jgi:DNA-binding CsgD family transcriptional regulator
MLDFADLAPHAALTALEAQAAARAAAVSHTTARYAGPERRSAASQEHRRMAQMLDALDYGMLLVSGEGRVAHINKAARRDLDARHPLQLVGAELRTRHAHDVVTLRDALAGAAHRNLRRLLRLGDESDRSTLAVVPLPTLGRETEHAVLLVLGKRQVCEVLTVDWYARSHGLTLAETAVIKGLCADLSPQEIATRQGVGLATIRTQIGSIRHKTGLGSIKALVREVAMLPPLVSALQGTGAATEGLSMADIPRGTPSPMMSHALRSKLAS